MAKIVEVEVEGLKVVADNLAKAKKRLEDNLDFGMNDYTNRVLAKAQQLCPVDTGKLRNSLHVGKESEFTWFLADGVKYGVYQEFGFLHKKGQFIQNPFALPAVYSTSLPVIKLD